MNRVRVLAVAGLLALGAGTWLVLRDGAEGVSDAVPRPSKPARAAAPSRESEPAPTTASPTDPAPARDARRARFEQNLAALEEAIAAAEAEGNTEYAEALRTRMELLSRQAVEEAEAAEREAQAP